MDLCELSKFRFKLIYRASRDGFSSKNFHKICDGNEATLTIIKTTNDYVFGGFTQAIWASNNSYATDHNSFIFSLLNKSNTPIKIKCSNPTSAIYNSLTCGPTFGSGLDFYLSSDSNANCASYSNLGNTYKHPLFTYGSNEAKNFLAGSYNFQTSDIEVYVQY